MSNLKKTSADIKKKLSFDDYSEPASKQDSVKSNQKDSSRIEQSTSKAVEQHAG